MGSAPRPGGRVGSAPPPTSAANRSTPCRCPAVLRAHSAVLAREGGTRLFPRTTLRAHAQGRVSAWLGVQGWVLSALLAQPLSRAR